METLEKEIADAMTAVEDEDAAVEDSNDVVDGMVDADDLDENDISEVLSKYGFELDDDMRKDLARKFVTKSAYTKKAQDLSGLSELRQQNEQLQSQIARLTQSVQQQQARGQQQYTSDLDRVMDELRKEGGEEAEHIIAIMRKVGEASKRDALREMAPLARGELERKAGMALQNWRKQTSFDEQYGDDAPKLFESVEAVYKQAVLNGWNGSPLEILELPELRDRAGKAREKALRSKLLKNIKQKQSVATEGFAEMKFDKPIVPGRKPKPASRPDDTTLLQNAVRAVKHKSALA